MGPLSSGDSAQPTPITLLIQMLSGIFELVAKFNSRKIINYA